METAQLVALVAFVLLAAIVALAVLRFGSALNRTRIAESFRGTTADLNMRVAQTIGEVAGPIDAVRRREIEAGLIQDSLSAAKDAVQRYADEARALTGPAPVAEHRQGLIEELERAVRALDLVDHGCNLARTGHRLERGPEADTAIKRGYLNLIHARESFAGHAAAAISAAESASPVRRFGRRAS